MSVKELEPWIQAIVCRNEACVSVLCNCVVCQALEYIGGRVKLRRAWGGSAVKRSKVDEARDTLQATVLSHVPVSIYANFGLLVKSVLCC